MPKGAGLPLCSIANTTLFLQCGQKVSHGT